MDKHKSRKRFRNDPSSKAKYKISGSFTVKGEKQLVWLVPPKLNQQKDDCLGNCNALLKFSSAKIPSIIVKNCIEGPPDNLGDLDGDGLDEIGILHVWFTSCWRNYDVYTLKQGKWELAVPSIITHCNQWDDHLKPVVKDPKKRGHVIVTYSSFEHNEIVVKTKSIPIN